MYQITYGTLGSRDSKCDPPPASPPPTPRDDRDGLLTELGIKGFSLKIFGLLGWDLAETEVFLAQVRNEMKSSNQFHAYLTL